MKQKIFKYKSWPQWAKWTSITFATLFSLLLIFWLALAWYINHKKSDFINHITTYFYENMSGTLEIKDLEPSIIKTFPQLSLRLDDIVIYDSLYEEHQVKTAELEHIYVQLNFFSLLTKSPKIEKIILYNGNIDLFVHDDGYDNLHLFKSKDKQKKESNSDLNINYINFEKIHFKYIDIPKNKNHEFNINKLHARINSSKALWDIKADLNIFIHQLGFNLAKGVFLNNKNVVSKLSIIYDSREKQLIFEKQKLHIEKDIVIANMNFYFGEKPVQFDLHFRSDGIFFKSGMALLSEHIASKFTDIDIEKPAEVDAYLHGQFKYLDTPSVTVKVRLVDNTLITPFGDLTHTTFEALFNNQVDPAKPKGDFNSGISVQKFIGNFEGVPLEGDSTVVYSLRNPYMTTRIRSNFPVVQLNNLIGSTINFSNGNAQFDLDYKGPLIATDTFPRLLNGFIKVDDAAITYVPNGLHFNKGQIDMVFEEEHLRINQISLSSKDSKVFITGQGHRFLNAYFQDPSQVVIETVFKSENINLNEFKSILNPQHKVAKKQKTETKSSERFNNHLALVLDKSTFKAKIDIDQVRYNQFIANDIKGEGTFEENNISLDKFRLRHAGGTVNVSANVGVNQNNIIPIQLDAQVRRVHVDDLFYAFKDFGIDILKSENLDGSFSADINARLQLTDELTLKENSINGKVNFVLENGALNNFEPLVNISRFIFKKRNLDSITFKEISNELTVKNGMVTIPPFEIASSAIRLYVDGVYGFKSGTDINIAVPLRNPAKNRRRIRRGKDPIKGDGFTIFLKAKEDNNGQVKLTWAPSTADRDEAIFTEEELNKHEQLEFDSD